GGAPSENRGVRRRGYYVLRKTNVPAVLVECGFLTNPTEAAYAQTTSYRQRLAEEIAAGVRRRNAVGSAFGTTRVATAESIPLQPYTDQTKVTSSKKSRSKRSHKKSARKKKSCSKGSGSEASAASSHRESGLDVPILTSAQMRAAEEAAFATGVQVEALMNKAGAGVAQAVTKFFQKPGRCIVFAGKGHNAGDALFAAQCLEQRGWKTEVRLAFKEADFSNLMRKKLGDLLRRPPDVLGAAPSEAANADLVGTFGQFAPDLSEQRTTTQNTIAREACSSIAAPLVILDGLLGVGARPPLREPIRAACRAINQLRTTKGGYVFAVDLPTGLDTDSGKKDRDCVVADFTVTIG